jgi:hypothetical protein
LAQEVDLGVGVSGCFQALGYKIELIISTKAMWLFYFGIIAAEKLD